MLLQNSKLACCLGGLGQGKDPTNIQQLLLSTHFGAGLECKDERGLPSPDEVGLEERSSGVAQKRIRIPKKIQKVVLVKGTTNTSCKLQRFSFDPWPIHVLTVYRQLPFFVRG